MVKQYFWQAVIVYVVPADGRKPYYSLNQIVPLDRNDDPTKIFTICAESAEGAELKKLGDGICGVEGLTLEELAESLGDWENTEWFKKEAKYDIAYVISTEEIFYQLADSAGTFRLLDAEEIDDFIAIGKRMAVPSSPFQLN